MAAKRVEHELLGLNESSSPCVIREDSYDDSLEITRFSFSKIETDEQPANSLLISFVDTKTSVSTTLTFLGVEMEYFPLLTAWGDATIIAQNRMNAQYEVNKAIEVFMKFCDDMQETLFWADSVSAG